MSFLHIFAAFFLFVSDNDDLSPGNTEKNLLQFVLYTSGGTVQYSERKMGFSHASH